MFSEIGADDVSRHYYSGLYQPGCLRALPWGAEPFDCVVFLCDSSEAETKELSYDLVRSNVDWVQVAGKGSREFHDVMDAASVAAGRQLAIGDGSPMTSCHEEACSIKEMVDVAELCYGGHENVLVLIVGQDHDLVRSVVALKCRLTKEDNTA